MNFIDRMKVFCICVLIGSCGLLMSSNKLNDLTKEFINSIIYNDYARCHQLMYLGEHVSHVQYAKFDSTLDIFKMKLHDSLGAGPYEYELLTFRKQYINIESSKTKNEVEVATVQISNQKKVGMLNVIFDPQKNKFLNITQESIIQSVPNMLLFWLLGLLAISVLIFNIYTIWKVKNSSMRKKWKYYLFIAIFNYPTICYSAVNGLSLHMNNLQLMGFSISLSGYLNSIWVIGIPVGAIYSLWKLRSHYKDEFMDGLIHATYIGHDNDSTD